MTEKRKEPERLSLTKYAKIELTVTVATIVTLFSGCVWLIQWGIGVTNAQASQVMQSGYIERVIVKQNDIIEKQNILIEKIDEKVVENLKTINDNRVEYLGLIATIRGENKDRNAYSKEKQEEILNEVRRLKK